MKALLLFLPLVACSTPECISQAGMRLHGEGWTCREFQLAEDAVLERFGRTFDPRLADPSWLRGYDVVLKDEAVFNTVIGEVTGLTVCMTKTMEIGRSSPLWVLPHEMAHAMQGCAARTPDEDGFDVAHYN